MENNLAALVQDAARLRDQFKANEEMLHSKPNWRDPQILGEHLDRDCEIARRFDLFFEDLVKEAERQGQITVAEINEESRAYETEHRGV